MANRWRVSGGGLFVAALFLIFALGYIGFAGYWFTVQIRAAANWEPGAAVVLSSDVQTRRERVSRSPSRPDHEIVGESKTRIRETHRATIEYEYTYGGRTYQNDQVYIGPTYTYDWIVEKYMEVFEPGMTVTAYVNPRNPQESVLDRSWRWHNLIYFIPGFFVLGVGLLVLALSSSRTTEWHEIE